MGPLHIKQNPELCGWNTNIGEVINESLSRTIAEIDLIFQKETTGSFQSGLFTDVKTYMFKVTDGS